MTADPATLVLHPFRAIRPSANGPALGDRLCPPYDMISENERTTLLKRSPDNAVAFVLPVASGSWSKYEVANELLHEAVRRDRWHLDEGAALYVYRIESPRYGVTAGLIGALELRRADARVVLPHERTMAGPIEDRLELMRATEANLEPIYLTYHGGGPASELVAQTLRQPPVVEATTSDGIHHSLWTITDPSSHEVIAADLSSRQALIADGHHRYATYLHLRDELRQSYGNGPWDRGLTFLVDHTSYGSSVEAIHRVLNTSPIEVILDAIKDRGELLECETPQQALDQAGAMPGFAIVLTDGARTVILHNLQGASSSRTETEAPSLPADAKDTIADELDVVVLEREIVRGALSLPDNLSAVGFAHSAEEAVAAAKASGGTAVLLRPTDPDKILMTAAAGNYLPRKSTLFVPKPATGLVIRRFADDG